MLLERLVDVLVGLIALVAILLAVVAVVELIHTTVLLTDVPACVNVEGAGGAGLPALHR